jgi:hypothetical protein
MAWSTQDLTNIEAAIAQGVLSVEIDGQRVTYRSLNDLLKAKSVIEQALNQGNPNFTTRQYRFHPKGGF